VVQPARTASGDVVVNVPLLNVRSGPGLGYEKIYQFPKGYVLEVHGRTLDWLYVQLPNGEFGWVDSVYTVPPEGERG
jgi:N-acetylmuramoyl-L-alanine amidase